MWRTRTPLRREYGPLLAVSSGEEGVSQVSCEVAQECGIWGILVELVLERAGDHCAFGEAEHAQGAGELVRHALRFASFFAGQGTGSYGGGGSLEQAIRSRICGWFLRQSSAINLFVRVSAVSCMASSLDAREPGRTCATEAVGDACNLCSRRRSRGLVVPA